MTPSSLRITVFWQFVSVELLNKDLRFEAYYIEERFFSTIRSICFLDRYLKGSVADSYFCQNIPIFNPSYWST